MQHLHPLQIPPPPTSSWTTTSTSTPSPSTASLGRGALGTVFLVSLPQPNTDESHPLPSPPPPFALKVMDPSSSSPSSLRRARWELSVLSRLPPHPFLPSPLSHLDSPPFFAVALPFCPGGDLHSLRHLQPDHLFSPSSIFFYSSELVSALHHLHSHGVVYRDLKPENVLIQSSGHLTLSDFDLSHYLPPKKPTSFDPFTTTPHHLLHNAPRSRRRRTLSRLLHFHPSPDDPKNKLLNKTNSARVSPNNRASTTTTSSSSSSPTSPTHERLLHSFVGTEEYVSPEVVRGDGHDFGVDWWALGVLLYEMAHGRTPFRGRDRKETFRNVLTKQPEFTGRGRTDLADLIRRLLEKDPSRRLGSRGGAEEVKAHPFFRGVRWEVLPEVGRPPYLPPCDEEFVEGGEGLDIREYMRRRREEVGRVGVAVKESPVVASPVQSTSVSLAEF